MFWMMNLAYGERKGIFRNTMISFVVKMLLNFVFRIDFKDMIFIKLLFKNV